MTTYYVRPNGDDAHTGTGYAAADAWKTWAKAITVVAAGDTVYLGPGTYRETCVFTTTGTAGNVISWLGDPCCEKFLDMNQGYVRITGCDANELPSATRIIDTVTNTCDYHTFKNLVVDGLQSDTNNVAMYLGACAHNIVDSCVVLATHTGIYANTSNMATVTNCYVVGGYRAVYACNCYNTIGFGPVNVFLSCATYDCIGIGGGAAGTNATFDACTPVYNCLAVGGKMGYANGTGGVIKNSIAMSCLYGFYGAATTFTLTNCMSIACRYGVYGTATGAGALGIASWKYLYCRTIQRGSGYETGAPIAGDHCGYVNLYKINELAHALRFDLFNEQNWGDDTATWTGDSVDILGKIRRLGDNTIDVGPLAYSNNLPEYTTIKTTAPAIKIFKKGELIFSRTVKKSVAYTVKVWVRFALDGGSDKPVLAVSALDGCISADSDTAAGDGSAFEQLSVTFTPTYDGIVQVKCQALENNANAYAIFSDLDL